MTFTLMVNVSAQAPGTIEKYTILQPYRVVNPGERYYTKVGTIGTNETNPCVAAIKVWNPQSLQLDIYATCRIQSDGYAAIVISNEGTAAVGIYDRITIAVVK
jgi:hypothetical protein